MKSLYPFQKDGLKNIRDAFKDHDQVCLAWYTGSGKTEVFLELCEELIHENLGVKIGILSYLTYEIKEQVFERALKVGLGPYTTKIEGDGDLDPLKNIFIFNPWSPYYTPRDIEFDYLIVDEAHVGTYKGNKMFSSIVRNMCKKNVKTLFATATPWDLVSQKKYKDIPVLKRGLDHGLKDGTISDLDIFFEEAQINFKDGDFSRLGNLKKEVLKDRMSMITSVCIGKLHNLLDRYGDDLGQKVVVVCPPGNGAEVARKMCDEFGGLYFIADDIHKKEAKFHSDIETSHKNLDRFKSEPEIRFLFVVHKCSVGFDMKELQTIVDLTMSRNLMTLAQRFGRVLRKHQSKKKYFYVYDKSLTRERANWIIASMLDFSIGLYDGWNSRTVKYRPIKLSTGGHSFYREDSVSIKKLIELMKKKDLMGQYITLKYLSRSHKRNLTLSKATSLAEKFASRHDLFQKDPSLYKWFRLNAIDDLNKIHPVIHHLGKWNEATVREAMKKCRNRNDFARKFRGGFAWASRHKELGDKIKQEIFGDSHITPKSEWTYPKVMAMINGVDTFNKLRNRQSLRDWMKDNPSTNFWRNKYKESLKGIS